MDKFWVLVEHLLNSLLFTLGGNVWGRIISNADPEHIIAFEFHAPDWCYMVLVYILMQLIRFLMIFIFYPIIAGVGLKTNWREALFIGWGGLRGAVSIGEYARLLRSSEMRSISL